MANLISLKNTLPTKNNSLYFSKIELSKILSAYSDGVIKGRWKDYAIDQNGTTSVFSIYRNSKENATFCLTKILVKNGKVFNFTLLYGSKSLESSTSLNRVLIRLASLPKVVKLY
jgi:predicted homoserine dehydrogenase-like protein